MGKDKVQVLSNYSNVVKSPIKIKIFNTDEIFFKKILTKCLLVNFVFIMLTLT